MRSTADRRPAPSSRVVVVLSSAVGVTIFALLLRRFAAELPRAWSGIDLRYGVPYLVLASLVIVAHSRRWQVVARVIGSDAPLRNLVAARLAGDAVGALMPSARVVGDPVRVALVYARGVPATAAAAGVALDRLVEATGNVLAAALYITVFTLSHRGSSGSTVYAILASVLMMLATLAIPVLLLRRGRRPLEPLYWLSSGWRRPGWVRMLATLRATEDRLLAFFRDHPRTFLRGVGASLLIEGLVILEYQALLRTFGIVLPLPALLVALLFSGLSRALPVPAGIGALEASQVAALAVAGEPAAAGFIVGLVMRLHETLLMAIGLSLCVARGVSLARLRLLTAADRAVA